MIKIDFSWIEDEADRAKLMAVWQAGDRDAYFKLHDAVWLKQLGIKELPSNSHQPNPNEEYYGDSRYQSKDSYLPGWGGKILYLLRKKLKTDLADLEAILEILENWSTFRDFKKISTDENVKNNNFDAESVQISCG